MGWEIRQWDLPIAFEQKEGVPSTFTREIFEGTRFLGVSVIEGRPYLSAIVDPTAPQRKHEFQAVPLGGTVYPHKKNVFIGEVLQKDFRLDYFLFHQGVVK